MLGMRGIPASYGGIERAVEELSVRLAERGHHVTVYCRGEYAQDRRSSYRGVHLRYLPSIQTKHLEAISHTALATVHSCFEDVDIVHYHGIGPTLLSPIARLRGRRVVATVQGLDHARAKWGRVASTVLRAGAWSSARFPHSTIVVSRELQRHFREHYGRDPVYAPNGVDIPAPVVELPPFDLEPGRYLLFLGRLVPEKAVHLLIRAYRDVQTSFPLVIAGPSSYTDDYLESIRREAAMDRRIRLVGPVYGREKEALLAHAYAFCQPSDLEGLPIALLEAMSHGRAAVVSDLPEHIEVVGVDAGFVFRRGDAVDLSRVLAHVLGNPDQAHQRGERARQVAASQYDWGSTVDVVEGVYRALCERPSSCAAEIRSR